MGTNANLTKGTIVLLIAVVQTLADGTGNGLICITALHKHTSFIGMLSVSKMSLCMQKQCAESISTLLHFLIKRLLLQPSLPHAFPQDEKQ